MTTGTVSGRIQGHVEALSSLRGFFKAVFSGELDASARVYQAGESRSHIYWLLGHMTLVMDGVAQSTARRPSKLPAKAHDLFGMGTQPDPEAKGYPPFDELMREFDGATAALIEALEGMSDGDLDRPLPENSPAKAMFETVGALMHGMVFHTAYHLGQVSILRRAQGLPSGFGM